LITKSQIKLIRSLEHKKFRDLHQAFIVEGDKLVREILASFITVECVFAKSAWFKQIHDNLRAKAKEIIEVNDKELSQISFQKTPNQAVALAKIPQYALNITEISNSLSLFLDEVQDPGNLGTIIRLADWFGINHVLCGKGCADPFSPKAVQSTMGAIIRVKTYQTDQSFFQLLKNNNPNLPVYGTFINGENLYTAASLSSNAVIVMGNESKGISGDLTRYINHRLMIPQYSGSNTASESLNVATAAGIVCAEFRRRHTSSQF
jgi:TrmH family RNA methyltransferase